MAVSLELEWGRPLRVDDLQRMPADGRRYELIDGALLVTPSPYTVDELQELPDDGHRYEIVEGALFVTPAPSTDHQCCVLELGIAFRQHNPDEYIVLVAPYEYRISPVTEVQPDVLVARLDDVGEKRLQGHAAVIVVEILSPSTRRMDLLTKKAVYEKHGVEHYWVVDPRVPDLTVHRLVDGAYVEVASVAGDEVFETDGPFPVRVVPRLLLPRRR